MSGVVCLEFGVGFSVVCPEVGLGFWDLCVQRSV